MELQLGSRVHIVGLGWGTTALAQVLAKKGYQVCASNYGDGSPTEQLIARSGNIRFEQFSDSLHEGVDTLVLSTAHPMTHPEVVSAESHGVSVLTYAQALSLLFNESIGIAVAGSHGKTTTSAWIAYTLTELGIDPTAMIGSTVRQFQSNARVGSSAYFVLEADEYQDKIALYNPRLAIITAIDYDHPDFFKTPQEYSEAFVRFATRVRAYKGDIVACWDTECVRTALGQIDGVISYGSDPSCTYSYQRYAVSGQGSSFTLLKNGVEIGLCTIGLPGIHNVANATAVFASCDRLGIASPDAILSALRTFEGTERRFEFRGRIGGTIVIDDYAHHPTEIRATLQAVCDQYPDKKIWCIFEPHTFTRTEALLDEFSKSFSLCDRAILLDIDGSVRELTGTVSSQDIVARMDGTHTYYAQNYDDAREQVRTHLSDIDVLVTLGAGNVWKIGESLVHESLLVNETV